MAYFDAENKKMATEVLAEIHDCAEKAGIRHALFVGFGLLLGIIRERDFIGHDNDVDMCVRSDLIRPDQELEYYRRIREAGLFFARRRWAFRETDEGFDRGAVQPSAADEVTTKASGVRFAWFSLRKRTEYCKFCHWFMFPWNGYMWHTKGNMWVSRRKFDPGKFDYDASYDALMKGIPSEYVEKLIKVRFRGVEVQIPELYGTCLDFWYPGWRIPRKGGASAKTVICRVKNWHNRKTWSVKVR